MDHFTVEVVSVNFTVWKLLATSSDGLFTDCCTLDMS